MVFTALVVAVVLIGGLMLTLVHSPGRNPETWEDITDSYIRYRGTNLGRPMIIEQAVKARTPSNFTGDLNLHTYGDAPYYYAVDETFPSDSGSWPKPYVAGNLTPAPTLI